MAWLRRVSHCVEESECRSAGDGHFALRQLLAEQMVRIDRNFASRRCRSKGVRIVVAETDLLRHRAAVAQRRMQMLLR